MQTFCLSFNEHNIYSAIVSIANAFANVARSNDSNDEQ